MKSRARGTRVTAIAQAVQSASNSAIQNEMGVAPKWNAAVNGRDNQRTLQSPCRPTMIVMMVMQATAVPKMRESLLSSRGSNSTQPGAGERQENRYQYDGHLLRRPRQRIIRDEAERTEDEHQRVEPQ